MIDRDSIIEFGIRTYTNFIFHNFETKDEVFN